MPNPLLVDWSSVFAPTMHLAELVVRGALMYGFLFALLRVRRREAGSIGIADVLVIVLVADASQNAMAGGYTSVTEGVVLVLTIALCDYMVEWLVFRFPWLRHWLRPAPLPLIRDGHVVRHNLRKELITKDELMAQLREQGIETIAQVKLCYLEGDGHMSVIQRSG